MRRENLSKLSRVDRSGPSRVFSFMSDQSTSYILFSRFVPALLSFRGRLYWSGSLARRSGERGDVLLCGSLATTMRRLVRSGFYGSTPITLDRSAALHIEDSLRGYPSQQYPREDCGRVDVAFPAEVAARQDELAASIIAAFPRDRFRASVFDIALTVGASRREVRDCVRLRLSGVLICTGAHVYAERRETQHICYQ